MKITIGESNSADEPFNRRDFAVLLGIGFFLGAFLMLTFTPQLMYEAWHRQGYGRTEVEFLSDPGTSRTIRVRVAASGEELFVRRNEFDLVTANARVPVWYNPAARLSAGATVFDRRVLSLARHPELPTFAEAIAVGLLNLALAGGGYFLVFRRGNKAGETARIRG